MLILVQTLVQSFKHADVDDLEACSCLSSAGARVPGWQGMHDCTHGLGHIGAGQQRKGGRALFILEQQAACASQEESCSVHEVDL